MITACCQARQPKVSRLNVYSCLPQHLILFTLIVVKYCALYIKLHKVFNTVKCNKRCAYPEAQGDAILCTDAT